MKFMEAFVFTLPQVFLKSSPSVSCVDQNVYNIWMKYTSLRIKWTIYLDGFNTDQFVTD